MSETIEGIHPATRLGAISLTVANLEQAVQFYQRQVGLQLNHQEAGQAWLGAGVTGIVTLMEDRAAQPPPRRATGLFHLAILVPSRLELAYAIQRLVSSGWPVEGASDHGVSEAIYLSDPEGNGIEIYRDYPRAEWPLHGGRLQMVTERLDLEGVMGELGAAGAPVPAQVHPDTVLGHVHLKVADIGRAETFYCDVLGFERMQRYGPSAAFVSAGGYHHHIGFNTWSSAGTPPPPLGSAGLRYFEVRLPDGDALDQVLERVRAARVEVKGEGESYLVLDPSQNGVRLTSVG